MKYLRVRFVAYLTMYLLTIFNWVKIFEWRIFLCTVEFGESELFCQYQNCSLLPGCSQFSTLQNILANWSLEKKFPTRNRNSLSELDKLRSQQLSLKS